MATSKTVRMLVLTNDAGEVIGAAHVGQTSKKKTNTGLRVLAGQQLHEVDVPEEFSSLAGHHLQAAFSDVRIQPGKKPAFRKVKVQRIKHYPNE